MFPERLASERLTFERLSRETVDVGEVYSVFGSNPDAEEVFEYVDSDPHRTVKETFDVIRSAEEHFEDGEWVKYAIRPKPGEDFEGEFVGIAGLYPKWDRRFATFGIVLDKPTVPFGTGYSKHRVRAGLFESDDGGDTLIREPYPGEPDEFASAFTIADDRVLAGTTDGRLIARTDDGWETAGRSSRWIRSVAAV